MTGTFYNALPCTCVCAKCMRMCRCACVRECMYECENVCAHAHTPICVHACACICACRCVGKCVCVCLSACGSPPYLPSGHGFIKHFINVKHHLHRQIKQAHTHILTQTETHPHTQTTSGKTEVTRSQWDDKIRAMPCKLQYHTHPRNDTNPRLQSDLDAHGHVPHTIFITSRREFSVGCLHVCIFL